MEKTLAGVSVSFRAFLDQAPEHAKAWMTAVKDLEGASSLDKKTHELAYIAVLAALRLESGIPFHVRAARDLGVSRQEVVSALLVGLPAAGNMVTQVLPAALAAYDSP